MFVKQPLASPGSAKHEGADSVKAIASLLRRGRWRGGLVIEINKNYERTFCGKGVEWTDKGQGTGSQGKRCKNCINSLDFELVLEIQLL